MNIIDNLKSCFYSLCYKSDKALYKAYKLTPKFDESGVIAGKEVFKAEVSLISDNLPTSTISNFSTDDFCVRQNFLDNYICYILKNKQKVIIDEQNNLFLIKLTNIYNYKTPLDYEFDDTMLKKNFSSEYNITSIVNSMIKKSFNIPNNENVKCFKL